MKIRFHKSDMWFITPTIFYINDKDWYEGQFVSIAWLNMSIDFVWGI